MAQMNMYMYHSSQLAFDILHTHTLIHCFNSYIPLPCDLELARPFVLNLTILLHMLSLVCRYTKSGPVDPLDNTRRPSVSQVFPVAAACTWNALPSSLRAVPSLTSYRRHLKNRNVPPDSPPSSCTINARILYNLL